MLFGKVDAFYPLRSTVARAIEHNKTFIEQQPPASTLWRLKVDSSTSLTEHFISGDRRFSGRHQ